MKKVIVISAINLVEAGTLAILRNCLEYLSTLAKEHEYRIVAIVYKKELVDFPNIEYIETQWPKKRWTNRLWYEYITMKKISRELTPVELWFSLHDTTPSVIARKRAVYCHNSFSFYKWKLHDLFFAPKIALFAIFTKYIYKTNIHRNNYLVVQQEWFRQAMSKMFNFNPKQIIIAPPNFEKPEIISLKMDDSEVYTFIYAASPNSHKNFEIICKAVDVLENQYNIKNFKVYITIKGDENKYARWLYEKWSKLDCLDFIGFVDKKELSVYYTKSNCLVFPSKVETWGLPISEFLEYNKPMLLADLPYAHETAMGGKHVAFINPDDVSDLSKKMMNLIQNNSSDMQPVPQKELTKPVAYGWDDLFKILLK